HNGTDSKVVQWIRPTRGAGLLRYSHPEHAAKVDSAGRACGTCHGMPDQPMMVVRRASPESCLTCHTHRATAHLADDNRCGSCHVAVTAARGLSRERIATFPLPPSHERAHFLSDHAPTTELASRSCATCHARESCARCHVNASTQPIIAALAPDERIAAIVATKEPVYNTPADHGSDDFAWGHGEKARGSIARCATCHARPSCSTCHTGPGASDVIQQVPNAEPGAAPGVRLEHQRSRGPSPAAVTTVAQMPQPPRGRVHRVRVHDAAFKTEHRVAAGAGALNCAGCHATKFCSDCHTGELSSTRLFHKANFAQSHATSSYGREADCASCHNAEAFCRACHTQSGLTSRGRLDVAYHTAQPQWLLQHGRAARQGLQNCTSCHLQRDCLTCHSTTGWGISPHGPGFDASREAKRAPVMCLACHVEIPGRPRP
ncbi:MAG: cytochrome c3 family protein, partial [Gemmatimonadota bacterium]